MMVVGWKSLRALSIIRLPPPLLVPVQQSQKLVHVVEQLGSGSGVRARDRMR